MGKTYNLSKRQTQDLLYDDFHIIVSCNLGNNWDSTAYRMVLRIRYIISTIRNKMILNITATATTTTAKGATID